MAENTFYDVDTEIKKRFSDYMKFMDNFDRGISTIEIDNKDNYFDVQTSDKNKIKVEFKLFKAKESYEIKKLIEEKKGKEVDYKSLIYGIKSWNLVDDKGNVLPINEESLNNLPDYIFKILLVFVKGKNKEPGTEELRNFFK